MTEATASIGRVFSPEDPRSRAMGADRNVRDGAFDANQFRQPEYFVYIYTTSDRDFTVMQPPLFPRLLLRARAAGEKYSLVLKLPSPFNQVDREGAVGDLMVRAHVAEKVAQSLLNPNNPTLDQDLNVPINNVLGLGVDLNAQGLFWSRNNPPTDEEVAKAIARKERYYRGLLEKARTLEISNPKELESLINRDYHMAAEYYTVETSWHRTMVRAEECPLCGESIKPGVAAHKNSLGGVCIIDEKRAALMGLTPSKAKQKGSQAERDE